MHQCSCSRYTQASALLMLLTVLQLAVVVAGGLTTMVVTKALVL